MPPRWWKASAAFWRTKQPPRQKNGARPAADLLRENRKPLVDKLTYWTGVQRPLAKKLVESIESRVSELGLRAHVKREREYLTDLLRATEGNLDEAARVAQVHRKSLERLIRKHKLRGGT